MVEPVTTALLLSALISGIAGLSASAKAKKEQKESAQKLEASRVKGVYAEAGARAQRLSLLVPSKTQGAIGAGITEIKPTETRGIQPIQAPSLLGQAAGKPRGGAPGISGTF